LRDSAKRYGGLPRRPGHEVSERAAQQPDAADEASAEAALMNERGRDVLMGAAVNSVRQLRREPADGRGGFSAMGRLLDSIGCIYLLMASDKFALPEQQAAHQRCQRKLIRRYRVEVEEWEAINRENAAGADFLTIAWAHCRPAADGVSLEELAPPAIIVPPAAPNPVLSGQAGPWPVRSGQPEAIVSIPAPASGYLKPCRSCRRRIYMQPDRNGSWRPYESWADGHAAEREWQLHRCAS
jgi:hypothetical protein